MFSKKYVKKFDFLYSFLFLPSAILVHFFFWQIIVISIYLGSRDRENFQPLLSNGLYLGVISLATLLMVIHLFIIQPTKKLKKDDKIYLFILTFPTLVLYVSMFINHDFRSMQSITLLFIIFLPIVIWRTDFSIIDQKIFNLTISLYSIINTLFVILQVYQIIPVAQINMRNLTLLNSDRPTGLLFNAFAMSYASLICFAIGLNSLFRLKNKNFALTIVATSLVSLILSGTRTSIWLGILITFSIIFHYKMASIKKVKVVFPTLLLILGVGAPFILLLIGHFNGNTDWSTLNGRTQMWSCVIEKSNEFIPFGVGLDEAFPPKFCADSGWFSELRHPENIFLLAFVESGPLGLISYLLLFVYTLLNSFKSLKNKLIMPIILTSIFLLSNLIYVSLFHYLPFLPNRPADRGIFNFHLFYLIWIWILKESFNKLKNKV